MNWLTFDLYRGYGSTLMVYIFRCKFVCRCFHQLVFKIRARAIVFNATSNNISINSWGSILLVEETEVFGENHRPAVSHWQIDHIMLYRVHIAMRGIRTQSRHLTTSSVYETISDHIVSLSCFFTSLCCIFPIIYFILYYYYS
jgi:hypothetical protein